MTTLTSLSELDRRRHIEPFITSLTTTANSITGEPITVADRIRRVHAVGNFLAEITEWGWDDAPPRRLIFRTDLPRPQRFLPRYLPVDADRKLTAALSGSPYRLAADALLVQRACGLRIGELLDLELDCIHEIPGQGSWLKVPLGKLDSERMVPLDEEVLTLVDRITATRSPGRPMVHPRTGAPADFLFTHHGKRLSQNAVREELNRAADTAGLGHITPHQLRHTYATALINAGVSLQALMALLGHVSTQMSLRYAHLFDHTVRTEYERALDLAKSHIGPLPTTGPPAADHRCHRHPLEGRTGNQITARRRLLPASTRARFMPVRQHLRALPQLSHRLHPPWSPCSPTHRRPGPGRRRRRTRMDRRGRSASQTHLQTRCAHRPIGARMNESALIRVERVCTELATSGQPITFTVVAEQAQISRATLYRDQQLRAIIDEHRTRQTDARTLTGLATEVAHLRTAVEALAEGVKRHEEQLRKLTKPPPRR